MKTLIKSIAVSALVTSFAAPSFAAVQDDIASIAGTNGNINVQVDGDTVTLTGYVADSYSMQLAKQTAEKEGYSVKNYLLLTD